VHIEHQTVNFDAWKAVFDRDPASREASGVRRYRIVRGVDEPSRVAIDLEFDQPDRAQTFLSTMQQLWGTAQAQSVVVGRPEGRIFEEVETRAY